MLTNNFTNLYSKVRAYLPIESFEVISAIKELNLLIRRGTVKVTLDSRVHGQE